MITRKIKIETISKVKDFVNEISKVDVNADLSNPDRRYIVDAKSILGILSLDISHVMNLTIYDEEKNAGKYEKIFEKFGVKNSAYKKNNLISFLICQFFHTTKKSGLLPPCCLEF